MTTNQRIAMRRRKDRQTKQAWRRYWKPEFRGDGIRRKAAGMWMGKIVSMAALEKYRRLTESLVQQIREDA